MRLYDDMRLAVRSLGRSPGFLLATVLSLGIGIGGGIAGFSVIDAIRFRALPFPDADRLVLITESPKGGCPIACDVDNTTFSMLRDQRFASVTGLAAFTTGPKSLGIGEHQVDLQACVLSASGFAMLGGIVEHGRTFSAEEDRLGAPPTMVVSHALFETYFGGDTAAIGKVFLLTGEPYTLIGVMAPSFSFEVNADVWLAASRYFDPRTGTSVRSSQLLARLAPGKHAEDLLGELRQYEGEANRGRSEAARTAFVVAPLRSRYVSVTNSQDLALAGIVAAILLIACANVSGLVLVRALRQRRELAIRSALGAGSGELARQVLAQNALIAGGGLAVGMAVASFVIVALRTPGTIRRLRVPGMEFGVDARVVAFGVALSVIVALVVSLAPLRLLGRVPIGSTLRDSGLSVTLSRGANRMQQAFVIVQTACAAAMLVGTGLLVRTTARFSEIPLAYHAERVASVQPVLPHTLRARARYIPLADRLLVDFAAIPGVESVGLRAPDVFGFARKGEVPTVMLDNGQVLAREVQPRSALAVSPGYFGTLGITVVNGRDFTILDDERSGSVVILNEWAARRWWPDGGAVGRTFTVDTAPGVRATVTVVGVVADNMAAAGALLLAKPGPEVYRPWRQGNTWVATYFARTSGSTGALTAEMQRTVMRSVPGGRPNGGPLELQVRGQVDAVRANLFRVGAFGVLGLLLAMTGLYGVLAYLVQQRTREIGIRGVLGAQRGDIVSLVLGNAARLALAGTVLGLAVAAFGTRLMQGFLFGTPRADPVVYAAVALLLGTVSIAAGYLPARRAARIDPGVALRDA